MSSTKKDNFTYSFSLLMLCIYLAWLAIVRMFSTMLNMSSESGHPCLVPDPAGKASKHSSLNMMLAVGFSNMAFIILIYVSSVHDSLSFYHEWMLIFDKYFFGAYWDDCMIFIFILLMWCIILIDFYMLNHPCTQKYIWFYLGKYYF